ncbi:head-tail connector protein [Roseibium sp.]|uniref:head-tail connector protein n=1 Tax=Roseibium sp. TaxID=1936156 RepID=UPI003B5245D1
MTSIRLTDPATEPVTVEEMRAHLRLNGSDEDNSLAGFLKAARSHIEQSTRRALISQTWRLYLDGWPGGRIVRLPVCPVLSVDQITVYDTDGNASQLATDDWQLDRSVQPERVKIKLGAGLPVNQLMAAEIDFTAGYGATAADIPEEFRQAVRLLAGHWFEHREAGSDLAVASLPQGLDRLLSTARVPLL